MDKRKRDSHEYEESREQEEGENRPSTSRQNGANCNHTHRVNGEASNNRKRLRHDLLCIRGTSMIRQPTVPWNLQADLKFQIKGLCCAPVTPFKENGDINPGIIDDYVQHLLDFGIPNIFANGTNGEGNNMTVSERKEMAETWVKAGKGKLASIVMHIGAGTLRESQELARHAEKIDVDAIACVSPTYHKPQTMNDYVEYMSQVAAAAPNTPFFLYDIDFVTGVTLSVNDFFTEARERIPTLAGVKHTSPDFISMHNVIRNHGDRIQVLLGSDEIFLEALTLGIEVPVMNSFCGKIITRMKRAVENSDREAAFIEQGRTLAVGDMRRKHKFSISGGAKAILRALGLPVGSPRLPLSPITDNQVETVKKELEEMGYFDWGVN